MTEEKQADLKLPSIQEVDNFVETCKDLENLGSLFSSGKTYARGVRLGALWVIEKYIPDHNER